ncbi:hypothetical protein BAE44_0000383 [Dichanthelium oligosanthes]|uniref:DUF4220 domain-containing protein n=1 Tax=Dichanthelium oligosanthes TaxID=888268 RepID=A0A1E5WMJ4_9POAL|nr:hypothetical protein BAE44_0000383 [Dichanthelium oligosanthes]
MGIKNSTTTFAQSLGSTQARLVRVEVLVLFSALIWILVELFGSLRQRSSHGFFRFFVWAVYTLFTVLLPYTIGLLQDGPFRDQTFVLWGTILLLIQVSADFLSVYSIHDIEQRKRMLAQHVLQIILVLWLIVNCKDYMMTEHEQIPQDFNPKTMERYTYIFQGEEVVASLLPTAPEYRVEFKEATWTRINMFFQRKVTGKCTTIDSVVMDRDSKRLLRIGEAGLAKTLDFVLHGLISEEDEVIVRVLSGFKESNGQLRWAVGSRQKSDAKPILMGVHPSDTHPQENVWHIRTTIAVSDQDPLTADLLVPKTLSDYCAYLVAFVPDMLPGQGYDTQRIFDAVVMETRQILTECDTVSSRCMELMMDVLPSYSSCTILELGGKLGRELRGVVPEERRWKVLADFWAEFILFLAPSSNVEIHAEKLAAGGEFMTHLWALLTHAGILERPSRTDGDGGNNGAPAAHDSPV